MRVNFKIDGSPMTLKGMKINIKIQVIVRTKVVNNENIWRVSINGSFPHVYGLSNSDMI